MARGDMRIVARVPLATICGGIIGAEREWPQKPAAFVTTCPWPALPPCSPA